MSSYLVILTFLSCLTDGCRKQERLRLVAPGMQDIVNNRAQLKNFISTRTPRACYCVGSGKLRIRYKMNALTLHPKNSSSSSISKCPSKNPVSPINSSFFPRLSLTSLQFLRHSKTHRTYNSFSTMAGIWGMGFANWAHF